MSLLGWLVGAALMDEWDRREEEKEARKDKKLARLHHGSFREEHEKMQSQKAKANKQQNRLVFWLVLLGLLLFAFYFLL